MCVCALCLLLVVLFCFLWLSVSHARGSSYHQMKETPHTRVSFVLSILSLYQKLRLPPKGLPTKGSSSVGWWCWCIMRWWSTMRDRPCCWKGPRRWCWYWGCMRGGGGGAVCFFRLGAALWGCWWAAIGGAAACARRDVGVGAGARCRCAASRAALDH